MDANFFTGLAAVLTPTNLVILVGAVLLGMIIGILPGLGPTATASLLLPLTYVMEPAAAVMMLAGIYYGAQYGGTITSVLLRLPGESTSVITVLDGYPMAQKGQAGPALGIAALGSFIGGLVALAGLALLAPPLAELAVRLGPPEYAVLAAFGILLAAFLGTTSRTKAIISVAIGLILANVGQDPIEGTARFTFGSAQLLGGIDFVVMAMGVFGLGEVLHYVSQRPDGRVSVGKVGRVWPSRKNIQESTGAITRGTGIGFFLGLLPGGGGVISSLTSYAVEKRVSKHPERFGHGAIQGVAGPETANNAGATATFVPLLTLGIPPNPILAVILGALLIQGITPGPQLVADHPDLFWQVVASMLVGNLVLIVLNIPLIGGFIQILRVRPGILGPLACAITMIGVFTVNNNANDMWMLLAFGLLGYLMRKAGFEPGPLVLAFILGELLETSLRQSLLLSDGGLTIFLTRPFSATVLALGVLAIMAAGLVGIQRRRASVAAQRQRVRT